MNIGAVTLTLAGSFLSFLRLNPDWQIGAQGAILIIVLALRGFDIHQIDQCLLCSAEPHADIALGNPQHTRHLAVSQIVQVKQYQRDIGFGKLMDGSVELFHGFPMLSLLEGIRRYRRIGGTLEESRYHFYMVRLAPRRPFHLLE